jgi:hypothetical protein
MTLRMQKASVRGFTQEAQRGYVLGEKTVGIGNPQWVAYLGQSASLRTRREHSRHRQFLTCVDTVQAKWPCTLCECGGWW